MRTNQGRRVPVTLAPMLLALGACGEVGSVQAGSLTADADEMGSWPGAVLVARDGIAVLEIGDDEVVFAGAPLERTVPLSPVLLEEATSAVLDMRLGGQDVSFVYDDQRDTMVISIGELRFTLTRDGEEVGHDGRRVRLAGGAKRGTFLKNGGVEISDLE